jgi:hypothetical protein
MVALAELRRFIEAGLADKTERLEVAELWKTMKAKNTGARWTYDRDRQRASPSALSGCVL